jgi:4-diphosphocytidyl-2-C-methyl-D-erythritol kinase
MNDHIRSITLSPCAKINLTLRVGPRRADGFHDVHTLLQSIDLSDTLVITRRPGPFSLSTRAIGVPADRTNLVWRAASLLWLALGREGEPRDARVRLVKKIPPAAGLGGGSADAAAALVGLNRIWGGRRSRRDLIALAAALGSDVPFFLFGGTAIGTGRGEEVYPVDDVTRLGIVVVKPAVGVATPDAYRWFDEDSAPGSSHPASPARPLDVGWPTGPINILNDLEAPVRRREKVVGEMVDACHRAGAVAAAMTGSGSAVFGVFPPAGVATAVRRLRRPGWLVLASRTLSRRESARRVGL